MSAGDSQVNATERAVEVAEELGVELAGLEGTGSGGRITVNDVRSLADASLEGPSATLTSAGRKIFSDVQAYLEEFDLWRPIYGALVERYVRNLVRSRTLREQAERNPTVDGSMGQTVANPLFAVARNAELDAHKFAESLMLTPEALKKHLRGAAGDDGDDIGF